MAEYCLGHKIDPLEYNRFHNTPEGQHAIEFALKRGPAFVNAVSGRGLKLLHAGSYFDQSSEMLAITKAIPQEQVEKHIEYEAQKLEAYKRAEERIKKSMLYMSGPESDEVRLEPKEVCRGMTKEELFPAILSTAHALSEPTPAKTEDKVINEEELQTYFANGSF